MRYLQKSLMTPEQQENSQKATSGLATSSKAVEVESFFPVMRRPSLE